MFDSSEIDIDQITTPLCFSLRIAVGGLGEIVHRLVLIYICFHAGLRRMEYTRYASKKEFQKLQILVDRKPWSKTFVLTSAGIQLVISKNKKVEQR